MDFMTIALKYGSAIITIILTTMAELIRRNIKLMLENHMKDYDNKILLLNKDWENGSKRIEGLHSEIKDMISKQSNENEKVSNKLESIKLALTEIKIEFREHKKQDDKQ